MARVISLIVLVLFLAAVGRVRWNLRWSPAARTKTDIRRMRAVWRTFFSGESGYMIAYRLKNGWKDLDETLSSTRAAADEAGGPGTYDRLMANNKLNVERSVGEMIEHKPELSSK